jgi:hypothetical protein
MVPELPDELWTHIFLILVPLNALLNPLRDEWVGNGEHPKHLAGWQNALRTKLSIVGTCSRWRYLGMELVWKVLCIRSLKELEIISDILQASRYRYIVGAKGARVLPHMNGYGQWIRRIETSIHLEKKTTKQAYYGKHVGMLLSCCPRLTIFINRNPMPVITTPSTIIDALSGLELVERLEWSGTEGLPVGELTYLLRSSPRLRTLVLGWVLLTSSRLTSAIHGSPLTIPTLTNLSFDLSIPNRAQLSYASRSWVLPSVHDLTITLGATPWHKVLTLLLERIGPTLSSLRLIAIRNPSMQGGYWSDLLVHCPNLNYLSFNAEKMPILPESIHLPNLTTVGLEGCVPDFHPVDAYDRPESDRREQLMEHLIALKHRAMPLRVIRMIGEEFLTKPWKQSRVARNWMEWKADLKEVGVHLVDQDGKPIV